MIFQEELSDSELCALSQTVCIDGRGEGSRLAVTFSHHTTLEACGRIFCVRFRGKDAKTWRVRGLHRLYVQSLSQTGMQASQCQCPWSSVPEAGRPHGLDTVALPGAPAPDQQALSSPHSLKAAGPASRFHFAQLQSLNLLACES